jgi:hypothetical protein
MAESDHESRPIAELPQTESGAPEIYEVPARMGVKDALGVVLALVLLVAIGVAGYVWLTPGMSFQALLAHTGIAARHTPSASAPAQPEVSMDGAELAEPTAATPPAGTDMTGMPGMSEAQLAGAAAAAAGDQTQTTAPAVDPLVDPQLHTGDTDCATCGMDSLVSGSQCVALWSDSTHTHHDSWDCLFTYGEAHNLSLKRAVVTAHGSAPASPRWLEAQGAWFLYGTSRIEMSMPPYVAAFDSQTAAEAAKPELGGEVVDFAGLQAHWK